MKRKVFISPTNPLALFPDQKFRKKREIYHNAHTIIITEFSFFPLMTILELENKKEIAKNLKRFLFILNANKRSIETLVTEEISTVPGIRLRILSPNAKKRLVLIFLLVDSISKEFKDGEEITEYVHKYIHEAKKYIEMNTQEIELNFKPLSPAMIARGQAAVNASRREDRLAKTKDGYRVGIFKTVAKNLKLVEKAFIDFGDRRGYHLDVIVIYLTDDKNIYLSVKSGINLSAIEILTKKYGKEFAKGGELLAQTTSYEVLLEESKELMYFIASNY